MRPFYEAMVRSFDRKPSSTLSSSGVRLEMTKSKALPPIQERGGGYSAGEKPVSQLKPPPAGPGAGAKPSTSNREGNER